MNIEEEKRCKKLQADIDRVDDWVIVAAENGLFNELEKKQNPITLCKIQDILKEARNNLDDKNPATFSLPSCAANISSAAGLYAKALNSVSRWWRFKNLYAGIIWIYLITFLISTILALYYFKIDTLIENNVSHENIHHSSVGIYAVGWGIIGGILRGVWYLKENVDDKKYRNSWVIWFLSSPFIGGVLGTAVYFFWTSGLISITKNDTTVANSPLLFALVLTFGFSWPNSINLIRKIANTFASDTS